MKATTVLGLFAIVLAFMWWMLSNNPNAGAGGTFCAEDETVFVQCRPIVNFAGVPVVAADNSAGNRIDVTLTAYTTVYDDGVAQSQQPFLNFVSGSGQTITCANNATSTRTDCTFTASGAAGSGYATVQNNGSSLTQRTVVNFINGTNATMNCVDNGGSSRTDCTVAASGAAGGYATIQASGSALTQRTVLNFQPGTTIIATDDAGNTRTNVTLDGDLIALAELASTGCLGRTGSASFVAVTLTAPAAGFTISNGNCSANPTFALSDDLAGIEALGTTGLVSRTAANTYGTLDFTDDFIPIANGTAWTTATMPDCIASGTALQYASATHSFPCRQIIGDLGVVSGASVAPTVPGVVSRSQSTQSMTSNTLYYYPVYIWQPDYLIAFITAEVIATGTTCRCGIYAAAETTLQPGALLLDAGTFSATTAGQKTINLATSFQLIQGRYLFAMACSGGASLRAMNGSYPNGQLNSSLGSSLFIETLEVSGQGAQITGGFSSMGVAWTATDVAANTGFQYSMFVQGN